MASNPLGPGDPAPGFALPAVNREGQVSLDDYRGRSPVLIAMFRGLHCPFCRRQLVQLGTTQDKLRALGVETMAVVNTPLERARLYFKYRPARVLLTLAGHTHGGQVNLPVLGRLIVPSQFGERYAIGHVHEDGRDLFVSPGIGTSIIPVRFRVPPEISLVTVER